MSTTNFRNITIIAHVDHGKTTLVDALLKQNNAFDDREEPGELIMDSNPLEKEKGITILAKNTSIRYKDVKVNIIDTPGHADFSGEVERVMNMADGCILLVDAVDGPMPQTRYVLQQAINYGLTTIVVINKIDRPQRRPNDVLNQIDDLFLDLATNDDQLDYPVLYASARDGYAVLNLDDQPDDGISPLLDVILDRVPSPKGSDSDPFQILVTALDHDDYAGQIAIGKISRGTISQKSKAAVIGTNGSISNHTVENTFVFDGMQKVKVSHASVGEIVAITGLENVHIGDTIADHEHPEPLPPIHVDEPTVKMTFGVNTSPLMGKEGDYHTTRELYKRLKDELRTNVGLRVSPTDNTDEFNVSGRGELHLSILAETMRREGYEFQVSQAKPIFKLIDGKTHEPYETLHIETNESHYGVLTENLNHRLAVLEDVVNDGSGILRLRFLIPTRGLIGFRSFFQNATRGDGIMSSTFAGYKFKTGTVSQSTQGFLVASQAGTSVAFGLTNAQERGKTMISAGKQVYEGMIVGLHKRPTDLAVNVCKEKKLTNMRSSTADITTKLIKPIELSLEESLDIISEEELIEITPDHLRLRKRILSTTERLRFEKRIKQTAAATK
ncbi:MAG: translational GTPase TypA [Dehalococcoidia bacterium]|nr:translational GTPase TypA [Dehalococcoidia bacterium]MQG15266.1 translational GTPase TypA [SAR202 cluster bacterium]